MRRGKGEIPFYLGWRRFVHVLLAAVLLCVVSISFELPKLLKSSVVPISESTKELSIVRFRSEHPSDDARLRTHFQEGSKNRLSHGANSDNGRRGLPSDGSTASTRHTWRRSSQRNKIAEYGRITKRIKDSRNGSHVPSPLEKLANEAWQAGFKLWLDLQHNASSSTTNAISKPVHQDACPHSIFMSGRDLKKKDNIALLPCGLMLGSSVTVVGTPLPAHMERLSKYYRVRGKTMTAMVSQFVVELQGLKAVDNEEPPKILHVNPRLRGDWSGKPIFEVNTCYRGQWGTAQRCNGVESSHEDYTVDGLLRCEKWIQEDEKGLKEARSTSWLDRLMGVTEKPAMEWHYPFVENQSFVFTIRSGLEGYHMSVDGRHIASSLYRTGFSLEDATGLVVKGDIDVHSVLATSLPMLHPTPEVALEMDSKWKVPPHPKEPFEFFIGILSASNHFAERMAIRKTWMQSKLIQTSKVVARFFVALHANVEIDIQLKKEAEFYGDIIIVPFVDRYELLVLKTVAICEYAIRNTTAKYIMKCDDDNFVRVETVVRGVKATGHTEGLYMGNINLDHRPLRIGKWAVTFEEWPEEEYPPYANGPGYVITRDVADFIVSQHSNNTLRLFKMEDVSMGMWVVQYNQWHQVHYEHSFKFCQFGCIDEYYTAHYQSPRHMFCMWEKLSQGKAECCNM